MMASSKAVAALLVAVLAVSVAMCAGTTGAMSAEDLVNQYNDEVWEPLPLSECHESRFFPGTWYKNDLGVVQMSGLMPSVDEHMSSINNMFEARGFTVHINGEMVLEKRGNARMGTALLLNPGQIFLVIEYKPDGEMAKRDFLFEGFFWVVDGTEHKFLHENIPSNTLKNEATSPMSVRAYVPYMPTPSDPTRHVSIAVSLPGSKGLVRVLSQSAESGKVLAVAVPPGMYYEITQDVGMDKVDASKHWSRCHSPASGGANLCHQLPKSADPIKPVTSFALATNKLRYIPAEVVINTVYNSGAPAVWNDGDESPLQVAVTWAGSPGHNQENILPYLVLSANVGDYDNVIGAKVAETTLDAPTLYFVVMPRQVWTLRLKVSHGNVDAEQMKYAISLLRITAWSVMS